MLVTGVNWVVERGVKGSQTRPGAGVGCAKEGGFRGLHRTPPYTLPQELETCQAHSLPEAQSGPT